MSKSTAKAENLKNANNAAEASPTATATPASSTLPCAANKTTEPPKSKVLRAYFAQMTEHISGPRQRPVKTVSFDMIENAVIGCKVCVVVETSNLQSGEINLQILGSHNTTFIAPNEAATFMFEGADAVSLKAKVGNFAAKTEYQNATAYKDVAIFQMELRRKDDTATKDYIKKIGDSADHRAYLHLSLTASGGNDTDYNCDDETLSSPNKEKSVFYNKANACFEVYACLCNKKLIVFDLQRLGISKTNSIKFLDAINDTLSTYSINTCLRLAHFMAQARHESGDFIYMAEIWGAHPSPAQLGYEGRHDLGNNQPGDGMKFKGRGLIQITGRKNYTAYGNDTGEDFVTGRNNERLEEVKYAVDTAGWYWSEHLDVDLNDYADKDDLIYCTYRINGGFNGYRDREKKAKVALRSLTGCRNTDITKKGVLYKLDDSSCYNMSDAVYKWANLLHGEGTDAKAYYQRYLDLTATIRHPTPIMQLRRTTARARI